MADPLASTDPRKSKAVFASAGTGKTWLLVARILRLLLDGARPDSILAITFTRKAAAEIQERLTERMEEWICLDDEALAANLEQIGVPDPQAHFAQARGLFEAVQFADQGVRVATFHAFFQELLQRFPLEAGVPVGFTIPQQEQTARLHQEAEDQLFDQAQKEPDSPLAESIGAVLTVVPNLPMLRKILRKFWGRILEWRAYESDLEKMAEDLKTRVFGLDRMPKLVKISQLYGPLARCAELTAKTGASENSWQVKRSDKIMAALGHHEPDGLEQLCQVYGYLYKDGKKVFSSFYPKSDAAKKRLDEGEYEEFMKLLNTLPPQVKQTYDWTLRQRSCAINEHWYRIVHQLSGNYQTLKLSQGFLDFGDLLWFAKQLVGGGVAWVEYKLGQRFRHVLVDEFQDTDALSWQTLRLFLQALAEVEDETGTAFIVGDTKQSIYQWRRANPKIQGEADNYLQTELDSKPPTQMDASRRSSRVITDFVNSCFNEEDGVYPLPGFRPHKTHLGDLWGRVELLPCIQKKPQTRNPPDPDVDEPMRDPLVEPRPDRESSYLDAMADLIAARVGEIIEQKVAIADRDGREHAARYRDFLVLVNRRTHVRRIEHAMAQRGIPYTRQSRQTLLQHLEVLDMQALLQCLVRPSDDLHLVQVLRSPLYNITDEELLELATQPAKSGRWTDRLQMLAQQKGAEHPLHRADRDLRAWRKMVGRIPTHDLLDQIYFETDALRCYRHAWSGEAGEQAASNLTRFIELTLEYDSGRWPSTSAFVQFIEEVRQGLVEGFNAPDMISMLSEDQGDRVEILTVHAAKGLERPIVVYAELDKPRKMGRAGDILLDWPADKPRPNLFLFRPHAERMDSVSQGCLEGMQEKEHFEARNRSYVAFTRARQMLILCQYEASRAELGPKFGVEDPKPEAALAFGMEPKTAPESAPIAPAPEPDLSGLDQQLPSEEARSPSAQEDDYEAPTGAGATRLRHAAVRGTVIHAVIELLEKGEMDPLHLERLARSHNLEPEDPEFQDWKKEAQTVFEDAQLATIFHPDAETRAYTEVPIVCKTDEGERFGIIDRLLVSPEEIWIIDFKSHRLEDRKQLNQAAAKYTRQMSEYARYMGAIYPNRPIRCSLLFTHSRYLRDLTPEVRA